MATVKLHAIAVLAAALALVGARAEQNLREVTDVDSVSCIMGPWKCSECVNGKQVRTRDITVQPQGRGKACLPVEQEIPCEPVSCKVGAWSDFSECDANGFKKRARTLEQPLYGGAACPCDEDIVRCKSTKCRVCDWSEWKCDKSTWKMKRTRHITVQPQDGGEPCPKLEDFGDDCGPPVDCVSSYVDDGVCDVKTGELPTKPDITQHAQHGGTACSTEQKSTRPCDVNYISSYETGTNVCDKTTRKLKLDLIITTQRQHNGIACPTQLAKYEDCKVDCEYTLSERSACYKDEGSYSTKYSQKQTVNIEVTPKHGGESCPTGPIVTDCINCVFELSNISGSGGSCSNHKKWKCITILYSPTTVGSTPCPAITIDSNGKKKTQVDC